MKILPYTIMNYFSLQFVTHFPYLKIFQTDMRYHNVVCSLPAPRTKKPTKKSVLFRSLSYTLRLKRNKTQRAIEA
jgi:hypothetical protein